MVPRTGAGPPSPAKPYHWFALTLPHGKKHMAWHDMVMADSARYGGAIANLAESCS